VLLDTDSNKWLDTDEVDKIVRSGDHVLSDDRHDRQIFLQTVQRVMNSCFDTEARRRPLEGERVRYVERFLGAPPMRTHFRPFGFDPASVGFFKIIDWNAGRRLDRVHNVGEVRKVDKREELRLHRQEEDWVDPVDFSAYVDEERQQTGSACPTLVGYDEDTRERGNDTLRLRVAQSWYFEHVAVRRYLRDHPQEYDGVVSRIRSADQEGGLSRVIRSAPNSNIVINVTVQSRGDRVMMLRRPVGARVWPAFYQAGAHETMNWSEPGSPVENCYELATRALREEINLADPGDYYDNIVFSWFGFYAVEASAYFFAHVKTRLEEDELVQRVAEAEGAFEVDDVDWYELDRPTVGKVLATWNDGPWRPRQDEQGRQYLPHATMSLTQLWRVARQGMLTRSGDERGA
jgi:hypothetical protein